MSKIGFNADYIEKKEEKKKEEKKDETPDMIIKMVSTRYSPTGDRTQLCYKTSREVAYEIREMVPINLLLISKALESQGYKLKTINDIPHWEMYDTTQ